MRAPTGPRPHHPDAALQQSRYPPENNTSEMSAKRHFAGPVYSIEAAAPNERRWCARICLRQQMRSDYHSSHGLAVTYGIDSRATGEDRLRKTGKEREKRPIFLEG
jgi:hypothetical protein